MGKLTCRLALIGLLLYCTVLVACSGNVGVGLSVGVPVGNNGRISASTGRWL